MSWLVPIGAACNLAALALVTLSARTTSPARLVSLRRWATAALAGSVAVLLVGVIKVFGAVGGTSIDPSQQARILAGDEDAARVAVALALLVPIPLLALVGVAVLERRASKSR